jgi:hypothetical protein
MELNFYKIAIEIEKRLQFQRFFKDFKGYSFEGTFQVMQNQVITQSSQTIVS